MQSSTASNMYVPTKYIVIAGAGITTAGLLIYHEKIAWVVRNSFVPRVMTRFIDMCSVRCETSALREDFRGLSVIQQSVKSNNHSHPVAAQVRGSVNTAIDYYINTAGYDIFSVSPSARDRYRKQEGLRDYYNLKDLALTPQHDGITSRHVLKFIDVDYYCNMRQWMNKARPMVLYTAVPERVAGGFEDGVYRFEDDELVVELNGGARYRHQLWDYDTDCLACDYWWGTVVYKIEPIRVGDIHRVIGMFPVRYIWGPLGWIYPGQRINRRRVTYNATGVAKKRFLGVSYTAAVVKQISLTRFLQRKDNNTRVMVSLAEQGMTSDICLPEDVLRGTMIRCNTKAEPNIADVERILRTNGAENPGVTAPLLFELLSVLTSLPGQTLTGASPIIDMVHYQTMTPLIHEDGDPTVREIYPPLCTGGAVAPVRSFNNDNSCVENRVIKPRNKVEAWPTLYHQYQREFMEFLVPSDMVHVGAPWDFDEVFERQNRPTQRAGVERDFRAGAYCVKVLVKAFQKTEVYPKIAAPRNISTLDADHRTRYSSYIYPLAELCKRYKWYAFGHEPEWIARRVHEVVRDATMVVPTDYSAWDGTHSKQLTLMERAIGRRFFAPEYHEEWDRLVMDQYNAPAVTKFGVNYNTAWSRLSGSSDTSTFNTVNNAFLAYVVKREMKLEPKQAWKQLGIYGGDDGITADVPTRLYMRVTKRLGHDLKAESLKEGDAVPFLGRYYLDPWTSPRSVSDIRRAVQKLHLTTAPKTVPDDIAIRRKAEGYYRTDPNTPIISHWCKLVLDRTPIRDTSVYEEALRGHGCYWGDQEGAPFPTYDPDDELAFKFAAEQFDCDVADIKRVCSALDIVRENRDLQQYPREWLQCQRDVKVPAAFQGELHQPAPGNLTTHPSVATPTAPQTSDSEDERSTTSSVDRSPPRKPVHRQSVGRSRPSGSNYRSDAPNHSQRRIYNQSSRVHGETSAVRSATTDKSTVDMGRFNNKGSAPLAGKTQPVASGSSRGHEEPRVQQVRNMPKQGHTNSYGRGVRH